jgi:hypothetical protein
MKPNQSLTTEHFHPIFDIAQPRQKRGITFNKAKTAG